MNNKLTRGISRSFKGSKPVKYKVVLLVKEVTGLPEWAVQAQVIWSRGQRVTTTETVNVVNGKAVFNQSLTHSCTMYILQSKKVLEPKNFNLRVKLHQDSSDGMVDYVLKQQGGFVQMVDLSTYVGRDQQEVPIDLKFDHDKYNYSKNLV
eukprot:TRINITY_DN28184_c2_g1_i2.p1 TRINITY_DN28184_c2_g1~~TRINITY_DN28184_c2_g1_i2.p1  ORF type:complete len:150 (-),score=6.45 TRINITY_DN28184_c2_g1_i2:49-498(-)